MLNIMVGVVRLRTAEVGVKRMASSTPVKSGVTVTVPVPSGRTGSVTVTKRAKAYPTKMSGSTVSVLLTETLTMGRISMMNQDWVMSYSETAVEYGISNFVVSLLVMVTSSWYVGEITKIGSSGRTMRTVVALTSPPY